MKYFFNAILLGYFVAALANSNLTTKPAKNDNETKRASQCNVNNNNYNSFFAGPNSKKIENMFSEVKQQLAELKTEIRGMKENQTGGPGAKVDNSTTKSSQCNAIDKLQQLFAGPNHTKKIENMISGVKHQLAELKEDIKYIKENQTGGLAGNADNDNSTIKVTQCNVAGINHTNKLIENMFSEVKQQLAELKQEIKKKCGKVYKNCAHAYRSGERVSGVYVIDPDGLGAFEVFCDHNTAGGGWTVFQKRRDGSVDFYRGWDDYKRGFGHLNGEFWLGLDKINRLTVSSSNKLRVDLEDVPGKTAFAEYSSFAVATETNKYRLSLGSYSGTAGDSLGPDRGAAFSTKDRDNDRFSYNCVLIHKSAWWHNVCHYSNLNGEYHAGKITTNGVTWYHWKSRYYSVKRSEMKIRPKDF